MAKIIDITGRAPRPNKGGEQGNSQMDEDDLPDIDDSMYLPSNSIFWPDPTGEDRYEAMTELSEARIAAIMIKGCFALYHLVGEHRRRKTRVPGYLLQFARDCEHPIIPAAEVTYFAYYCEGGTQPEEIPDDLYLLGCVECKDAARCTYHALSLHRLLEAFADAPSNAQRNFLEVFPAGESRPFVRAMFAEHRLWRAIKDRLKPV